MDELHRLVVSLIEVVGLGFDVLGVLIIMVGVTRAMIRYLRSPRREGDSLSYRLLRNSVGRTLLLGLEVLVAADIIKTVAVEPDLTSVTVLALLVLVRTFLSWTLTLEIEGRWPWQKKRTDMAEPEPDE